MELYFETYLIIALLFAIFTICIACIFRKNLQSIIGYSVLTVFLGFFLPNILITFQVGIGSLYKIDELIRLDGRTLEEYWNDMKHIFVYPERTPYQIAFDYFTHNFGFIVLSIVIGIIFGILVHLLLKKQKRLIKEG